MVLRKCFLGNINLMIFTCTLIQGSTDQNQDKTAENLGPIRTDRSVDPWSYKYIYAALTTAFYETIHCHL